MIKMKINELCYKQMFSRFLPLTMSNDACFGISIMILHFNLFSKSMLSYLLVEHSEIVGE